MLIGLMAPTGSGKSEASKYLKKRYGFARLHAGQPVKEAFRQAFGLDKSSVDGKRKDLPHIRLGGATPRAVMEPFSDALAEKAPQATAIALQPRLMQALSQGRDIVIDGIRQQAEADLIHRHDGEVVAIDGGRSPDPAKPMDLRQAQIIADHIVHARGKAELKAALDALLIKLIARSSNQ
jgi:dephospho-CoA kinase